MKLKYTKEFEVECDMDQAEEDFHEIIYWNPEMDFNRALYDAIEDNLVYYSDGDIPQSVIEEFAQALRKRIGGIQIKMELD